MNIEEVEEPKKHENYHAKPVSNPFKTIAERRKTRELPRVPFATSYLTPTTTVRTPSVNHAVGGNTFKTNPPSKIRKQMVHKNNDMVAALGS